MASEKMTIRELFLADSYQAEIEAQNKRIAELEAALREIIDAVEAEEVQCGPRLKSAVLVGMGMTF